MTQVQESVRSILWKNRITSKKGYRNLLELQSTLSITLPPKDTNTLGIIQFVHGMCEHKGRYKDVIEYFNRNGFICAISDLRGHGDNVDSDNDLGYFGRHGDLLLINDIHEIIKHLKSTHPGLPFFLIGHSMGSLIVRCLTKKYDDEIDGLFVLGSPSDIPSKSLGKLIIKLLILTRGDYYRSKYIQSFITSAFKVKFHGEDNINAWLTSDKEVYEKFTNDPKCGFIFTLNGYWSLINLFTRTYSKKGWVFKNPDLPITFLSGKEDVCMINRLAFDHSMDIIKDIGYTNVHFKLYKDCRHEILNDIKKDQVYKDILNIIMNYI